jgi:hypothetical protein
MSATCVVLIERYAHLTKARKLVLVKMSDMAKTPLSYEHIGPLFVPEHQLKKRN